MDPTSLAASTVAILAPYLAEAGHEFAKEAGKTALSKIGDLYETLKTRFKSKSSAQEAFSDLELEPNNEDVQATIRRQLTKEMKADQKLVKTLRKLVDEIEKDQPSRSFLTQVYGGEVGQIINAGHINSISYNPPSEQRRNQSESESIAEPRYKKKTHCLSGVECLSQPHTAREGNHSRIWQGSRIS